MNITAIKTACTQFVGRTGLLIKKHSPEILIGVGVAATVGAIVSTIIATKKSDKIIKDHTLDVTNVKITFGQDDEEHKEVLSKEDEKEYKHDLTRAYLHTGLELVKVYTPTVLLTTTSLAAFLGAYGIVHKRNVALTAAYTAVSESFKAYRKRVVDELGEDKDYEFRHGLKKVEEIDPETKTIETRFVPQDDDNTSQYSRFFDESSRNFKKCPEHNLAFLRTQQDFANHLLKIHGHLFLNEVYDMLDIPRSQAGALVGWVMGEGRQNYVDFGLSDPDRRSVRDFVNGYDPAILLDFNVDGLVYDLI